MRPHNAFVLMITLCLAFLTVQEARPGEIVKIKSWSVPIARDNSLLRAGDNQDRNLMLSSDLTSGDDNPILVVAGDQAVWYLNIKTLEVLHASVFSLGEEALISRNGEYIAVLSKVYEESTKAVIHRIRIEDWLGNRLWETDARFSNQLEPTPTGGLVFYPSLSWEEIPLDSFHFGRKPAPRVDPNPLLIYDSKGSLIVESIPNDECRSTGKGVISQEGRYLAFAFPWIPPSNRERGSSRFYDRACLVLYDLKEGAELWRKYLGAHKGSRLTITSNAERIFGFITGLDSAGSHDYKAYLFDRDGNSLIQTPILYETSAGGPNRLAVSPDESLCAFSTGAHRAYLVRLVDGRVEWTLTRPKGSIGITCLAVSNEGRVLLRVAGRTGEDNSVEYQVLLVDGEGQEIGRLDVGEEGAVWSDDGDSFWLDQRDAVVHYAITGTPRMREGNQR